MCCPGWLCNESLQLFSLEDGAVSPCGEPVLKRGLTCSGLRSVVKTLILTLSSWRDPKCSARSLLEPYNFLAGKLRLPSRKEETKEGSSWPSKDVKFFFSFFFCISSFILLVLSVQLKNLCTLSKSPSTGLHPRSLLEIRYCYIAQPSLKPINLAQSPTFWDYRCVLSPCPV